MTETFKGFRRATGRAGVRNKVLILPLDRYSNQIAWAVGNTVAGVTVFQNPGDMGRHARDRERLYRVVLGLARNPNVHSVIAIGVRMDFNYPETRATRLLADLEGIGKPIEMIEVATDGGMGLATLKAQKVARRLIRDAALQQREEFPLSELLIGIKCGISDGTSGISGNPALGRAMDVLVGKGGSVIISETTEVIGAEHILAGRANDDVTRERLLEMVARTEAQAKSVGDDIRSINPIPSNIKAGITTLEEKSLGAIAKGGTTPLMGAIDYGFQPEGDGLFFMDSWMAGNALMPGLAAAGAQITIFQSGGGDMPDDPPVPAIDPGIVAPLFFMTGNPNLAAKLDIGVDYDSSPLLSDPKSIGQIGEDIVESLVRTADGQLTWGETMNYKEVIEVWFDGPFF